MILASPIALLPGDRAGHLPGGPGRARDPGRGAAAGAFVGALLSGWVPRVRRVGRALVIVVALWGLAMAGFGVAVLLQAIALAPLIWTFPLALVLLAVAGAVDMFSAVFRNTILQLTTPDELRGRVTSIHILVVTGGPRLGDIQAALVAAAVGPGLAVVAGGLLCVLGVGVISRRIPSLPAHVLGEGGEGVRART
ncbi:MAG: hypothetical protein WKF78_02880 [Candidatus Limnocylindrales bacterium]